MSQGQLRTIKDAKLMLLFIQKVPTQDNSFNGREQTLLSHIKGHSYSSIAIKCDSEQEAHSLMMRFVIRGHESLCLRYTVGYPSIMMVDLMHVYVRGNYQFAIVREYISPDVPNARALRGDICYLAFCIQPVDYPDLLLNIRKKWDSNA